MHVIKVINYQDGFEAEETEDLQITIALFKQHHNFLPIIGDTIRTQTGDYKIVDRILTHELDAIFEVEK
jgi:hypothetical protein